MDAGGRNEFDPLEAMAATRPLVVGEMIRRLECLQQRLDRWDPECDRALSDIWWLTRWIEGRVARNQSR